MLQPCWVMAVMVMVLYMTHVLCMNERHAGDAYHGYDDYDHDAGPDGYVSDSVHAYCECCHDDSGDGRVFS